jgi:hypothetical protein
MVAQNNPAASNERRGILPPYHPTNRPLENCRPFVARGKFIFSESKPIEVEGLPMM